MKKTTKKPGSEFRKNLKNFIATAEENLGSDEDEESTSTEAP